MRQPALPVLLLSLAVAFPAVAAPADFGLPQGHPYSDLSIDVELTRSMGGGQTHNPYMWLSQTPSPNPGWDEVAIVATPQTGVCGIAAYAFSRDLAEGEWRTEAREMLDVRFKDLSAELGRFMILVDGEMIADYSVENALSMIEQEGNVMFYSAAENRPDVKEAGFGIQHHQGVLGATYQMAYQNVEACAEIILP